MPSGLLSLSCFNKRPNRGAKKVDAEFVRIPATSKNSVWPRVPAVVPHAGFFVTTAHFDRRRRGAAFPGRHERATTG
jgi:hypothetical protein